MLYCVRLLGLLYRCVHLKRVRHFEQLARALVINLNPFDADQVGLQGHQPAAELLALCACKARACAQNARKRARARACVGVCGCVCASVRACVSVCTRKCARVCVSLCREGDNIAWPQHADMHHRVERDERRASHPSLRIRSAKSLRTTPLNSHRLRHDIDADHAATSAHDQCC